MDNEILSESYRCVIYCFAVATIIGAAVEFD